MLIRLFMDSDGGYWVSLHRCIQMAPNEWCHKYAFRFMDKSRDEIKGFIKVIVYDSLSMSHCQRQNEIHSIISLALPMMPDSISDGVLWSILTL